MMSCIDKAPRIYRYILILHMKSCTYSVMYILYVLAHDDFPSNCESFLLLHYCRHILVFYCIFVYIVCALHPSE